MIDPTICAIWFCATIAISIWADLSMDTRLDRANVITATDFRSRIRTAKNRLLRR